MRRILSISAIVVFIAGSGDLATGQTAVGMADSLFRTADMCMGCHNQLVAPNGEDVSIGFDWRSSMMANAARDPYWQAGVRREMMDHPAAAVAIEDKCSICHMPMARYMAHAGGGQGEVFTNLPVAQAASPAAVLAADGVSCATCHQIDSEGLGQPESFTGGFSVDHQTSLGQRIVHGPFEVDAGRQRIMRSASGFAPEEAPHIQSAALCGSCHTLYTHALNAEGEEVGELPEQMPYLEWLHSAYADDEKPCQSCHMPEVEGEVAVSGVLGQPRAHVSRHVFRGGNFFMPRLLNRYRTELGVQALPQELDATASRSMEHLRTRSAVVRVEDVSREGNHLEFELIVDNLAGHKLPTAYPSRRAWLHVIVADAYGNVVFESGAVRPDGSIVGNDNDDDPGRFEPHRMRIETGDDVQLYEAIMGHYEGGPTTGLLNGVRYLKDNRLLPDGFDKVTADHGVAVQGSARNDADFAGGSDRIQVAVSVADAAPLSITAELLYQPIAYRWAHNLSKYEAEEPQRFVRYFEAMASGSYQMLARTSMRVE
jgi:hypothetical protein